VTSEPTLVGLSARLIYGSRAQRLTRHAAAAVEPGPHHEKYIDNIPSRTTRRLPLFSPTRPRSFRLPAVGRCGPLITPNLYTPPGVGVDAVRYAAGLTTYSVTLNTTTGTLAGEINEAWSTSRTRCLPCMRVKRVATSACRGIEQQGNVQILATSRARLCADGEPY